MASIALCMITKNEEATLPAILAMLRQYVNEVVIVDSLSTDRTKFIAEQFGAWVLENLPVPFNYSAQRNLGLDQVKSDWIISIDGDELPSARLCTLLRVTIEEAQGKGYDSIAISRVNYTSGVLHNNKSGEDFHDMHVRIFRSNLRWDGWHSEGIKNRQKTLSRPDLLLYHLKSLERGVQVHEYYRSIGMPVWPFPKWFQEIFGVEG